MRIKLRGTWIDVYFDSSNEEQFLSYNVRDLNDDQMTLLSVAVADQDLQVLCDLWDQFN